MILLVYFLTIYLTFKACVSMIHLTDEFKIPEILMLLLNLVLVLGSVFVSNVALQQESLEMFFLCKSN